MKKTKIHNTAYIQAHLFFAFVVQGQREKIVIQTMKELKKYGLTITPEQVNYMCESVGIHNRFN